MASLPTELIKEIDMSDTSNMNGTTGKIAYMTQPGSIELRDYALPREIEPRAALLEVLQTNVCGSDIHVFEGRHPLLKCGGIGHEMVGRILRKGCSALTDSAGNAIAEGDRVVPMYTAVCRACDACNRGLFSHCEQAFKYFGKAQVYPHFQGATFATHYYLHEDQPFYRVPDGVSTAAAATANCALAQIMCGLERAEVSLGEHVVIQGAGGLGLCAAAVAKERGAKVLVMDRIADRLETAKAFGADEVLLVSEDSTLEQRVEQIQRWSRSNGADVAIEVTGVPQVFSDGVHYLKTGGRYLVMGTISTGHTAPFDPGLMVRKSVSVLGVNRYQPRHLHEALAFLARVSGRYPFDRLLDRRFKLSEARQAIEMSARREIQRATIVVNEEQGVNP